MNNDEIIEIEDRITEISQKHYNGELISVDDVMLAIEDITGLKTFCKCGNHKLEESDFCRECV